MLVIEYFIICCHRVHGISFQVEHIVFYHLPLPWELLPLTDFNPLAHGFLIWTSSPPGCIPHGFKFG